MIITLIGFRGVGKSSIAPLLAARLAWDWIDADAEIIRRCGLSIPQIFAQYGESVFRQRETEVIAELATRHRLVVAAGGGAIINPLTRERLRTAGPVVWLQASIETIWSRIGRDIGVGGQRPALTSQDPRTEIEQLVAQRESLYAETASLAVEADSRSPASLVDEILARLPLQSERPE